jgi:hypothetical protein
MTISPEYALRFFVEWGGGCLWPNNDAAHREFGSGPLDKPDTRLPLTPETVRRCGEVAAWHDTSLNLAYPSEPSPWRQPACDRFNEAVRYLLATVRGELGDRFEVTNEQPEAAEGQTWMSNLRPR